MAASNKKDTFDNIFQELERRVQKLTDLSNNNLVTLTRHFCAILSKCDNELNKHFAENALTLFTFVGYEIETLTFGQLSIVGQEKLYKGFISKQCGSFSKETTKSSKKDSFVRLTTCCVEYLNMEVITFIYLSDLFDDLLNIFRL